MLKAESLRTRVAITKATAAAIVILLILAVAGWSLYFVAPMGRVTTVTTTVTAGTVTKTVAVGVKPYVGYHKFGVGKVGYAEFGAVRAAIYSAVKKLGGKAYNLDYIAEVTGLDKDLIAERIDKMTKNNYTALIMTIDVGYTKWFPYWVTYIPVKLKPGTPPEVKASLMRRIRDDKFFCTSYELEGDFDFWIGFHHESWAVVIRKVIEPILENRSWPIAGYTFSPISAQIRHGMYNFYAAPPDLVSDVSYPSNFDKLPELTGGKLDEIDVKIIKAWNRKLPLEKMFNWDEVARLAGKSKDELISLLKSLREDKSLAGPFWAFNWKKLGIETHFFFVQLKNAIPDDERKRMIEAFAKESDFSLVYYHNDGLIKFTLAAEKGLADIDKCREKIKEICGDYLVKIYEADVVQQMRWWTLLWYPEAWNQPGGAYVYKKDVPLF